MNKRGLMFTLAAVFLVMVILATFLIQASNTSKTNIETSSIKIKTTNSFMDSLINNYLPDALEMTIINSNTPLTPSQENMDYLNNKIDEIKDFASNTGITFTYTPITTITVEGTIQQVNAEFTITFSITNQEITYTNIQRTIRVENIIIP